MQSKELDAAALNYIDELKANYEQQIHNLEKKVVTLEYNYENKIHKLQINANEYQNKYLEIKERYALLLYKRFMRSAEQIPIDDKQRLLFTDEVQPEEHASHEEEETQIEVKSHTGNQ